MSRSGSSSGSKASPRPACLIVGFDGGELPVEADGLRAVKIYVTVPREARASLDGGSTPLRFVVTDAGERRGGGTRHDLQEPGAMSTTAAGGAKARGIRGGHVLAAMLAFFAVIIVADATMIYKALTTFGGVDNPNAYRQGVAYNQRIARDARADR